MLLTIGMPVFNASSSVLASIESVLAQDWRGSFELLIVDDGSTDKTAEILKTYSNDPRIRVVQHETNLGRPYARNTVLKEAAGEYLTWIDADDVWRPEKLRLQFDSLCKYSNENDRAISICSFEVKWEGQGRARQRTIPIGEFDIASILDASIPAYLWTMLCRTDWYRGVGGFDQKLSRLQDTDIILRMLKSGCYFIPVDADYPLCTYNKSDSGKTGAEVFGAMQHIFEKHKVLYRRYGPEFYHRCRSMQHDLGHRHARANSEITRQWNHAIMRIMHQLLAISHRKVFLMTRYIQRQTIR